MHTPPTPDETGNPVMRFAAELTAHVARACFDTGKASAPWLMIAVIVGVWWDGILLLPHDITHWALLLWLLIQFVLALLLVGVTHVVLDNVLWWIGGAAIAGGVALLGWPVSLMHAPPRIARPAFFVWQCCLVIGLVALQYTLAVTSLLRYVAESASFGLRRLVPRNAGWDPTAMIILTAMAIVANIIYENVNALHRFIIRVGALPIDPDITIRAIWRAFRTIWLDFWNRNAHAVRVAVEQVRAHEDEAPQREFRALIGPAPHAD